MSVACDNCGAAVQLPSSLTQKTSNDSIPAHVKAQIHDLKVQNANLVVENDSLASKLVESTEGRTDLDQQLNIAQMELQAAQSELKPLRETQKHYDLLMSMITSGQLIEKKDVQPVIENLAYESQRRSQIESSKMKLESELEDLSRSLFEEANRMVNEERQATYLAEKKIEALERQLDEVLDLCKSEREQLVELKVRMGKLSDEKDAVQRERDAIDFAFVQLQHQVQQHQQQHQQQYLHSASSPTSLHHHISTAAAVRRGMTGSSNSTAGGSPLSVNAEVIGAGSRKHVQQIMQYDARQHRSSASSVRSRTDSCYFSDGDHPGSLLLNEPNEDRIPSLGFHLWDPSFIEFKTYIEAIFVQQPAPSPAGQSVTTSGITSMYSFNLITRTTAPPSGSAGGSNSTANAVIPINTLLSNCRLLKKMSSEDVEATLRFDPGNLPSWTQRKRLVTAVTENTLVVEAVPISSRESIPSPTAPATITRASGQASPQNAAGAIGTTGLMSSKPSCGLCGCSITTPLYYQYRLTDASPESRTICPYCRTRLTSVCTFYSVLRMLSKRIITSTTTPEKLYLDFLRIRLGMFLARCGVGIVTGDEAKQPRRESASARVSQLVVSTLTPSSAPAPRAPGDNTQSRGSPTIHKSTATIPSTAQVPTSPTPAAIIATDLVSTHTTLLGKSPVSPRENILV